MKKTQEIPPENLQKLIQIAIVDLYNLYFDLIKTKEKLNFAKAAQGLPFSGEISGVPLLSREHSEDCACTAKKEDTEEEVEKIDEFIEQLKSKPLSNPEEALINARLVVAAMDRRQMLVISLMVSERNHLKRGCCEAAKRVTNENGNGKPVRSVGQQPVPPAAPVGAGSADARAPTLF